MEPKSGAPSGAPELELGVVFCSHPLGPLRLALRAASLYRTFFLAMWFSCSHVLTPRITMLEQHAQHAHRERSFSESDLKGSNSGRLSCRK